MKKNQVLLAVVLIAVVVGGIFYFNNKKGQGQADEVIKIGAILPLSESGAIFADYIKSGIELKLDEINDQGKKIEILYEDSKNIPSQGISAYRKLNNINGVKIFIPAMSSISKALVSFASDTTTLQLGTAVAFPNYTSGYPNVFRFYPNSDNLTGVMAKYFLNNINVENVGIVYVNDEFGMASMSNFRKTIEGKKNVVISEPYEITQKDFKQTIEKLNNSNAGAVYLSGYGPAYISFIKQLKELQKKEFIIMGDMTLGLPSTFEQIGNLMEGVYYVDGEMSEEFISKYEKKHGKKPSTYAGYAYDLLGIFYQAYKKGDEQKDIHLIINNLLQTTNYKGCMGDNISIDEKRELNQKFVVHKVENGKITVLK